MCIDISDVTFPVLWIPIFLAVQFKQNKTAIREKLNGSDLVVAST
jgi:hypothetical protein